MNGIPVLTASGNGIAEAWENSLVALYEHGCDIKTMYDRPEDPPSKDSTMMITIENPLAEPMIHKDFPGGLEDLQEYTMEVVEGIKNHLVRDQNDPEDTRWEYTYNERLFKYNVPGLDGVFDQIEIIAAKLAKTPYSRRAQAITWKVWEDNSCYDPACLQSIWCRITTENDINYLNANIRFRSNDAYKAAFMNIFALVQLQKKIAERIAELSGKEVRLGRYVHFADSYHIYGSYFNEFKGRFIGGLEKRNFEDRTYNYADIKDIMDDARPMIMQKVAEMSK
ncbi:MAG: thymidylate synthase [Victivallaceae bacterium]|nr:thymidylate synthase [Victivallaceae bacterium]